MAKDTATKTIIYVILGMLVVLSWGIAFGAVKRDVVHIGEQTDKNTVKIDEGSEERHAIGRSVTRIETRQEVVIDGLDEIKTELRKR